MRWRAHTRLHVQLLSIQFNPKLTQLTANSISGIHADGKLEVYLSNNNLSEIAGNAFANTRGLRKLDLTENPLSVVSGTVTHVPYSAVCRCARTPSLISIMWISCACRVMCARLKRVRLRACDVYICYSLSTGW